MVAGLPRLACTPLARDPGLARLVIVFLVWRDIKIGLE